MDWEKLGEVLETRIAFVDNKNINNENLKLAFLQRILSKIQIFPSFVLKQNGSIKVFGEVLEGTEALVHYKKHRFKKGSLSRLYIKTSI